MPVNPTLPDVGGDDGTWGEELNTALTQVVSALNAEETARAAADAALDVRVDALEIKPDAVTTNASALTTGTLNVARIADGSLVEAKLAQAVVDKLNSGGQTVAGVSSFNTRTGAVSLTKADVTGTGLAASDVGAVDTAGAAAAAPVQSVAGRTGAVSLVKGDVGLGNVDNTSDAAKPVSTATQTALDGKLNTSARGAANGVASLGADGIVPSSQLPPAGAAGVTSFNTRTGAVSLTKADVTGTGLAASDVGAYVKPGGGIPETDLASAVQTKLNAADNSTDARIVSGTVAGQVLVWDTADNRYEPVTPTDAVAADVPFTPSGTLAATNVQAALVELDTEKAATGHVHTAQGISVQDENGTAFTSVTLLDFQGAGVTAAAGAAGEVIVTVPGGGSGGTITTQDEGTQLSTTVTTLNFTGAGVTASGSGATTTVNIPGGSGSAVETQGSYVGTTETTTSTTFVSLTTVQAVTVTVPASGKILVSIGTFNQNNTANGYCVTTVALSGANTVAAGSTTVPTIQAGQLPANAATNPGIAVLVTGLTAGSTTVTLMHRVNAGTGSFGNRSLVVQTVP